MKAISYYGGKQRIAGWVCEHIPPHTVYVEPFCGGAAVLFRKGLPRITDNNHYREVINDQNGQLITMYRELQNNPELERRLKHTLYSRAEHKKAKQIWKDVNNGIEVADIDIAWAFFVNIHMSFSFVLNAGWSFSILSKNPAATWYNKINIVKDIRDRLQYCHIENDDALKVIDQWDSPQTCFYCDPPYPGAVQGHYGGYTIEDYQSLIDKLQDIKGSFVLSNYAQGIEPEEWTRIDKQTSMTASRKNTDINKKRTESIFLMDRSADTRQSLQAKLWSPSRGFVNKETK